MNVTVDVMQINVTHLIEQKCMFYTKKLEILLVDFIEETCSIFNVGEFTF